MRILLLNYEFPPMGGGAGRAAYHTARNLIELGHEVDVLTSRLKSERPVEHRDGFTIYRVRSLRKGIHECGFRGAFSFVLFAALRFRDLIRTRDYDVLHCFFSLPTGLLLLTRGRSRKIPYVLSLRGSDVPHYDPYNRPLQLVHRLLKPLTVRIWLQAAVVVANSPSLRTTALQTNPAQKIVVIPNGIDTELFRPVKRAREPGRSLHLIAVARLIERKGIQHVLAALSQIPQQDVSLTIVGTGSFEGQLRQMCRSYALESVVRFHGYGPPHELRQLYGAADVFILTSLAESSAMVFLEAMACGLPVIASRTGGIPSIVSHENGLLVSPGAVDEIRQAIVRMRHEPELRRQMGRRNRKKVGEQFGWPAITRSYLNLYRKSMQG